MKIKKVLSAVFFIFLLSCFGTSPVKAQLIKEVCIGLMLDAPSQIEATRYYLRYHGPENVRLLGPWLKRYETSVAYTPPEEAVDRFGAVGGHYTEVWFGSEEEWRSRPKHGPVTLPSWEIKQGAKAGVMVPALPTEEFYDPDPNPEKIPIIRWITAIRYPDGISVEEGEKWFLEVYAKEALKQPGLMKFVSHRVLQEDSEETKDNASTPNTANDKQKTSDEKMHQMSGMPKMKSWVRICEYWYKDFDDWRKAVIESPPNYTAPSWGGRYPFVEMVSTFLKVKPDYDFLKGDYIIP